jgi:hypothetical protein
VYDFQRDHKLLDASGVSTISKEAWAMAAVAAPRTRGEHDAHTGSQVHRPLRRAALVHDGLSRDLVRANHRAYAAAIDRSAFSIQIASPYVDAFPLAGASQPAGEPERAPAGPHRAAARAASVANFDPLKSSACHHRSVVLEFRHNPCRSGRAYHWDRPARA